MMMHNPLESSASNDLWPTCSHAIHQGDGSEERELGCYLCRYKIVQNHLTLGLSTSHTETLKSSQITSEYE